jgi:polyisoprenoid-binding protein YceI
MMRLLAVALQLLLLSSHAWASQWIVDHGRSRLGFAVLWSGEPFAATFRAWTADIRFDPANLGHSRIVANIDLSSEGSDTPDNDDGLKGPQGFWIERFRFAHFESTKMVSEGLNKYRANGVLSLHGSTRQITLPFALTTNANTARAVGHARLLRADFGLGTGEWAGDAPIAHEVDVTFDIAATKTR